MLKKLKVEKKNVKTIFTILLILLAIIIICSFLLRGNIQHQINILKEKFDGKPINLNTGIINNEYFNISRDGTNSEQTTKGINRAIVYAYKNNIKNIKLENGTYLIKIDEQKKGIIMCSNISLDLNNSILQVEKNSYDGYKMFYNTAFSLQKNYTILH